jgi:dipeptide/tripeptide permease
MSNEKTEIQTDGLPEGKPSWRFPRTFWTGNAAELCERAAYYGTFIALRTYLIRVVGLDDVQAGVVAGLFGGWIYLVPFFTGAAADRMGFRKALILAFALLTVGYGTLGVFHTLGPVLVGLALIVLGGAFVKPVITGTVAKSSDSVNRARAFSIFYMVVNIGSFTGKTVVAPMRIQMGVETVPYFSAGACLFALILVMLIYRPPDDGEAQPKNLRETLQGMWMAMSNVRFLALILITAGFWAIQGQLYASMPDYVLRMAGETYKPEWYANVNPLVVVLFVVAITQLVRKWKPQNSILVAMAMIPLSSLAMASSSWFRGNVNLFGIEVHPITLMMVIGIAIQGLAECFLSPKWLEFASKQAPRGKEGVFLGFGCSASSSPVTCSGSTAPNPPPWRPQSRSSTRWRWPARRRCRRSTRTPTTCGTPTPVSASFHSSASGSTSGSPIASTREPERSKRRNQRWRHGA